MALTRRDFLLACGSLLTIAPQAYAQEEIHCDLLIVGAGIAGLTAACIAKDSGIENVLVIEKEPVIGGSSIVSRGSWVASETSWQTKYSIKDSNEALIKELLTQGEHKNNVELVKAFVKANTDQINWVIKNIAEPKTIFPETVVSRVHQFDCHKLIFGLRSYAISKGVRFKTGVRARELIVDNGKVSAALCTQAGNSLRINASKAVLLATGGFSRNPTLLERVSRGFSNVQTLSAQGCEGDGLLLAGKLNADYADLDQIKASYAFIPNSASVDDMLFLFYYGAIIVNSDCIRFVNESAPYKQIAQKVLTQPNGKSYLVFDSTILKEATLHGVKSKEYYQKLIDEGLMFASDSIESLARKAKLDHVGLINTVEIYNEAIKNSGSDPDYGRTSFNKNGKLLPIVNGPFYVIPAAACLLGTYGGLKIDERARVLDKDGKVISGLYAAGEVTGGIHGANPIMGAPLAAAASFGRIAALDIAKGSNP